MRIKSIKAPGKTTGPKPRYPWKDVAVGGMFEITNVSTNAVHSGASHAGKRLGRRFKVNARKGKKGVFVVRRIA